MVETVTKLRLLKILDILRKESDDEHYVETAEIIRQLAEMGIKCQRRTLWDDIELLNENGYEILCEKETGYSNKYCLIKRTTIIDAYKKVVEYVKGQPLIKKILNPTTETLAVEERIKNLMAQEKMFLQMKARGMESEEIDTEHRRVVYRIKEAERERKRLMENNIHNATAHNELVDFNNTIMGMGAEITYNESEFKTIVKRIVVYSREEIDIVLRNGMTAKVHIEEMFREDDIIGEIEYGISEEHNDN